MDLWEAWEGYRARNELEPRGEHPVEFEASRVELCRTLGRLFGTNNIAERFEFPDQARIFWERHGAHHWVDGDRWSWLGTLESLATQTDQEWEVIASDPPENEVLWVVIGGWSDKHVYMLCCDRTHPWFGSVADFYDGHPWWGSTPYSRYPDVAAFFANQEAP